MHFIIAKPLFLTVDLERFLQRLERRMQDEQEVLAVTPVSHNNRAKRALTKRMLTAFCDGQFHPVADIASAMQVDVLCMRQICNRIVQRGTYCVLGERRRVPPSQGGHAYRFVKGGKRISLEAFQEETHRAMEDMEKIIFGPKVDFSQQAMQVAFAQFRKAMDRVVR